MDDRISLNATETAKMLSVSRPSLYMLMNRAVHPLPSIRIGRRRVIPVKMLMRWIEEEAASQ